MVRARSGDPNSSFRFDADINAIAYANFIADTYANANAYSDTNAYRRRLDRGPGKIGSGGSLQRNRRRQLDAQRQLAEH